MDFETARDYRTYDMNTMIECIIRDAKLAGSITYPLRTEGYHQASNLLYTERLK